MLSRTSASLLTTLHPKYTPLKSKLIGENTNLENSRFANAKGLNNFTVLYDIAEKDVNPDNALIVLKKRTYRGYIVWLSKNHANESTNLRLSPKKLDTRVDTEQFIMLHSKYHPYSEELNRFILAVEVITKHYNVNQ